MSNLLENLDRLIKEKNTNRAELARVLGTSQSTISSWYSRGTDGIKITTLKKMCAFFNVTLDELINGDGAPTSLVFDSSEYTADELKLIEGFAKMLKESR